MVDSARTQVLSALAMGRMALDQAFSNPQFANQSGFNPAAMSETFGLYLQMLEGAVKGLDRLDVDAETLPTGHVNPAALLKTSISSNPLVPPQVQDKFKNMNSDGLEIPFRVNVDGQLKSESRIPLKLLSALGQLK